MPKKLATVPNLRGVGSDEGDETYGSIFLNCCIEIGVDYLQNHMIKDSGDFTWIMMALTIYPRRYHLTLADLMIPLEIAALAYRLRSYRTGWREIPRKGEKRSSIGMSA